MVKLVVILVLFVLAVAIAGPIIGTAVSIATGLIVPIAVGTGTYYLGRSRGRRQAQIGSGRWE